MVRGLTTSVNRAATATLARVGMARTAAMKVCITGMMTATNKPKATPRGTDLRVIRQREPWVRCGANGRSKRCRWTLSRVGMWRVSQWNRPAGGLASATVSEQPLLLPLPIALFHRLALVMHLLTTRQRQFDLRAAAAIEINGQRNERQALARHCALQLGYLTVLEQ